VEEALRQRLQGLAWRQLPYRRPGLPLSQVVAEQTAKTRADVLILGNHGLLVGAESCDAAEALIDDVERRLDLPPRSAPAADLKTLERICSGTAYRPARDAVCHGLGTNLQNLAIATKGSLYPDHVVFLGPALPTLPNDGDLAQLLRPAESQNVPPPVALLVPGAGAIIREDASAGAEAMLVCLALVVERIPETAQVRYLPALEEQALLNWDAERYRQQMMAARSA
jgi:rhamnose utilization protein RhaD (predicted bifunctional aldolase and dehydrogenase)